MSFISTTIRSSYSKENITSRRGKNKKWGQYLYLICPPGDPGESHQGRHIRSMPPVYHLHKYVLAFWKRTCGSNARKDKKKKKQKRWKEKKPNNFDVSNESFFNCEFVIPHLKLSIGTFSHKQTNKLWPHNELGPRTKFAIVIMFCMSGLPFW